MAAESEQGHPWDRGGKVILCGCGEPEMELECWVAFKGTKPIINLPANARVRLRIKKEHLLSAFVKSPEGIAEHLVFAIGDHWELSPEVERFSAWASIPGRGSPCS